MPEAGGSKRAPVGARGVSELTSAALLALIVLIAGGFVVSRIIALAGEAGVRAERHLVEQSLSMLRDLETALAYVDSGGTLHAVVVTGPLPIHLYSIYVNGVEITGSCTVELTNGTSLPASGKPLLPSEVVAHISCSDVAASEPVEVRIVYEGGEAVAIARSG